MRSAQTHFFATRSDLIPGLQQAEALLGIKYVRCDGLRRDPDFEQLDSLSGWESLGQNNSGDHHGGYHFLVVSRNVKIRIEEVRQVGGGVRYSVNQLLNPDSVSFRPGGIFNKQPILVCGHIGTASETEASKSLYKQFAKTITRGFEKVGSYKVGPEAVHLMNKGYRMVTIGVTSPPAYDLRGSV